MKILLSAVSLVLIILTIVIIKVNGLKNIKYQQPAILSGKRVLTVYYSNGGHTKDVAQNIHNVIGGDIKEIELYEKYPNNIFRMSTIVRKQMKQEYLPNIKNIDISNYDVIFVGSPIWNFSISLPVKSFLKNNNFKNKVLIPFYTYSGGASKNKINQEINDLTDAEDRRKALFMFENGIIMTKEQVINWLNKL